MLKAELNNLHISSYFSNHHLVCRGVLAGTFLGHFSFDLQHAIKHCNIYQRYKHLNF